MSIGTAMAISGAAANPNMGYHSSPAVTFLLTLFNARLGWWLGNPGPNGDHTFNRAGPYSPQPIFDELLGRTTDTNAWVHVSDGGHFENLGLYEMVQRRCRYIVVCDAGCDPAHAFDDLGNAIRKIRIDLGVPIKINDLAIHPRSSVDRGHYAAVGTIQYDDADGPRENGSRNGTLIYIKPALTGSEPTDVTNYASACGDFPHESTTDQWFSESQFESYRALGHHAMESLCRDVAAGATMEHFIEQVGKAVRETPATRPWRMPVDVLVRPAT
jgi:hypothetical protein